MRTLKRYWRSLYTAVIIGGMLAVASSPVLAADTSAAQRSMFKELLPIFIAVALPLFIIFTGRKSPKSILAGITVGVMAYVIGSAMVGTI